MDGMERSKTRDVQVPRRQPPNRPEEIVIRCESRGELPEVAVERPILLTVESTEANGDLSPWFDEDWWTEVISRYGNGRVTVHIAPTPGALLDPVVLNHMITLRRVMPSWRLVGHAFRDDLLTDSELESAATSLYHELRVLDADRKDSAGREGVLSRRSLGELFTTIRRVQAQYNITRPVLVRLPAPEGATRAEIPSAWAPYSSAHVV